MALTQLMHRSDTFDEAPRNKIVNVLLALILLSGFGPSVVRAQDCHARALPAEYFNHFDINGDGTVTDIESGLTWSRCVTGQHWDGKTCSGEAKLLTWGEAWQLSRQRHQQGDNDDAWRLPKLNELATIVDMRCKDPRIDLSLFPNTAGDAFWTSNSKIETEQAYVLSFGKHGVTSAAKTEKHYVRLVQGRD